MATGYWSSDLCSSDLTLTFQSKFVCKRNYSVKHHVYIFSHPQNGICNWLWSAWGQISVAGNLTTVYTLKYSVTDYIIIIVISPTLSSLSYQKRLYTLKSETTSLYNKKNIYVYKFYSKCSTYCCFLNAFRRDGTGNQHTS